MNFIQFARNYKVVNGKVTKLPSNVVARIFPTYSSNPRGQNYPNYCKYQLLRYKPWQLTQNHAWNNQEDSDEVFVRCWQEWMIISDLHMPFETSDQDSSTLYNWQQDRTGYTEQQIGEMPPWIKAQKDSLIMNLIKLLM